MVNDSGVDTTHPRASPPPIVHCHGSGRRPGTSRVPGTPTEPTPQAFPYPTPTPRPSNHSLRHS